MRNKIKVLIVDDSAVVRQTIKETLESDPEIEVMATASDPFYAVERLKQGIPDVITLDVEMPRMDGVTFLKKIMTQHPIPVVMVSSLTQQGSKTAMQALAYGAVDIITKPQLGVKSFIKESNEQFRQTIKAAAEANVKKLLHISREIAPKLTADAVLSGKQTKAMVETTEKIVVVGASTGGTEALRYFLEALPHDTPGIVIVQHMPENFTASFAERLNGLCRMNVKEAVNGDTVIRGQALIAPGHSHMLLKRSGARYYVEVKKGPLVNRHRPSVDVLFRSAARYAGANAIGIIMTGMGDDGAKGLLEMKETGAQTIAQDKDSCVVFGMPHEAIKLGAAQKILPLQSIPSATLKMAQK